MYSTHTFHSVPLILGHSLSREGKNRETGEKEQARTVLFTGRMSSGRRQNVISTKKMNTVEAGNTTFHPVML